MPRSPGRRSRMPRSRLQSPQTPGPLTGFMIEATGVLTPHSSAKVPPQATYRSHAKSSACCTLVAPAIISSGFPCEKGHLAFCRLMNRPVALGRLMNRPLALGRQMNRPLALRRLMNRPGGGLYPPKPAPPPRPTSSPVKRPWPATNRASSAISAGWFMRPSSVMSRTAAWTCGG